MGYPGNKAAVLQDKYIDVTFRKSTLGAPKDLPHGVKDQEKPPRGPVWRKTQITPVSVSCVELGEELQGDYLAISLATIQIGTKGHATRSASNL